MTAHCYYCARCGERARWDDTFLCDLCLAVEARRVEQATAERLHPGDHKAQRALLIEAYGWKGWHRRISKAGQP